MNFAVRICWRFQLALVLSTAFLLTTAPTGAWAHQVHRTLAEDRAGFKTHLITHIKTHDPIDAPPAGLVNLVHYNDPLGSFPAYVTVPPTTGRQYPAIIWIFGGFDNEIDDTAWTPQTPDNDQSAMAFRQKGIVTMYPSRRGGNNNPGYIEDFYGEVDDILAAARWLAAQSYVDPNRIYLGGHSTGGTLALLTAESSGRFRAVFSFGPVSRITEYGTDDLTYNYNDPRENDLRSPILYLDAISSPTYVIEGTEAPSNSVHLEEMQAENTNPLIHFYSIPGQNHFSELAVSTPLVAAWIANDTGPVFRISYSKKRGSR